MQAVSAESEAERSGDHDVLSLYLPDEDSILRKSNMCVVCVDRVSCKDVSDGAVIWVV